MRAADTCAAASGVTVVLGAGSSQSVLQLDGLLVR